MQNLREAIKTLKNQEDAATDPAKKDAAHVRAVNYLKRYFHLILFASYVKEQASLILFDLDRANKIFFFLCRKCYLLKRPIRCHLVTGLLKDLNMNHYCTKMIFQKWIQKTR